MCVGTGEYIMGENKKSEDSSHFCCFIVFFFYKNIRISQRDRSPCRRQTLQTLPSSPLSSPLP